MRIFDFFKKKKKEVKKVEAEKPAAPQPPKLRTKKTGAASLVLKSPHITEKAEDSADKNQYVFKVFQKASKVEIKKAVEQIYGVDVLKVRTIKVGKKPKRLARTAGWKKGYKKAVVTLKQGQKIEILPR